MKHVKLSIASQAPEQKGFNIARITFNNENCSAIAKKMFFGISLPPRARNEFAIS
jgi:hypothetical protein